MKPTPVVLVVVYGHGGIDEMGGRGGRVGREDQGSAGGGREGPGELDHVLRACQTHAGVQASGGHLHRHTADLGEGRGAGGEVGGEVGGSISAVAVKVKSTAMYYEPLMNLHVEINACLRNNM